MIYVKMMSLLAKRARSHKDLLEVGYEDGSTPASILTAEGFSVDDQEAITALVNDHQVDLDQALSDGDRLELLVGIQGG